MKKNWQAPRIRVQEFEANEYVATCYDMFCAIAGDGYGNYKEDVNFNRPKQNWGNFNMIPADGLTHGEPCAKGSSYDDETGLFYEVNKPATKVESSSIHIGDPAPKGGNYATWISTDSNGDRYQHYGYAVENMKNHPNHS